MSWRRVGLCLVLLLLLGAQGRAASLVTLYADLVPERRLFRVELDAPEGELAPEELSRALRAAGGTELEEDLHYAAGRFPLSRRGLRVEGRIDTAPILAALRRAGVAQLRVRLNVSGAMPATCTGLPGAEPEWLGGRIRSFVALIDASSPGGPVTLTAGWSAREAVVRFWPLLVLLAAPLLAGLVFRVHAERTLRRLGDAAARGAILGGYLRLSFSGMTLFWLLLCAFTLWLQPMRLLDVAWSRADSDFEGIVLRWFVCIALPGVAVQLAQVALAYGAVRRLAGVELTLAGVLALIGFQSLNILLPTFCLLLGITAFVSAPTTGLARALGWLAVAQLLRALLPAVEGAGGTFLPMPLAPGPLRARLEELAERAGVRVERMLYLETGSLAVSNAFAARGQAVIVTDRLIAGLTRREVDAVVAHELAHLKLGHPTWLARVRTVSLIVVCGLGIVLARYAPVAAGVLAIGLFWIGNLALSRRFERDADRLAAQWTGDGAALVTGLGELGRLNGAPESWSRWDESLMTHPSNRQRAELLTNAGLLDASSLGDAMARRSTEPRYPSPQPERVPVISAGWRMRRALTQVALGALVQCAVPLATASLADRALAPGLPVGARVALLAAVAIATGAILVFPVAERQARLSRTVEARLRERLDPPGDAELVGLTPGAAPRQFPQGGWWDYGFVWGDTDGIHYRGEKASLILGGGVVEKVAVVRGLPGLSEQGTVALTWGPGEGASCLLTPARSGRAALLAERLTDYRSAGPEPDTLPYFPAREGWTPREMTRPAFIRLAYWLFPTAAYALWSLLNPTWALLPAALAPSLLAAGYELWRFATFLER